MQLGYSQQGGQYPQKPEQIGLLRAVVKGINFILELMTNFRELVFNAGT